MGMWHMQVGGSVPSWQNALMEWIWMELNGQE